jgi:hypothetical protein
MERMLCTARRQEPALQAKWCRQPGAFRSTGSLAYCRSAALTPPCHGPQMDRKCSQGSSADRAIAAFASQGVISEACLPYQARPARPPRREAGPARAPAVWWRSATHGGESRLGCLAHGTCLQLRPEVAGLPANAVFQTALLVCVASTCLTRPPATRALSLFTGGLLPVLVQVIADDNRATYCAQRCADAPDKAYTTRLVESSPYYYSDGVYMRYNSTTLAALVARMRSLIRKHVIAGLLPACGRPLRITAQRRAPCPPACTLAPARPGPGRPGQGSVGKADGAALPAPRSATKQPCSAAHVHPPDRRPSPVTGRCPDVDGRSRRLHGVEPQPGLRVLLYLGEIPGRARCGTRGCAARPQTGARGHGGRTACMA